VCGYGVEGGDGGGGGGEVYTHIVYTLKKIFSFMRG